MAGKTLGTMKGWRFGTRKDRWNRQGEKDFLKQMVLILFLAGRFEQEVYEGLCGL